MNFNEFMLAAIDEAEKSLEEGGIPIGAVLAQNGEIISRGHNRRVQDDNPLMHAEINCLMNAGRIGSFRNCTLYSTLMPCYLCAGAIIQFGIKKVIAGESANFSGAEKLLIEHGVEVVNLDLKECKNIMTEFIDRNPKLWNEDIGQ